MGFFDWLFKGSEIQPNQQPYMVPGQLDRWADVLFGSLYQGENGGWGIRGTDRFPGQLSPDLAGTMLPNVWGAWSPQGGAGQQYLNSFINGGGFQMPSQYTRGLNSMIDTGGIQGTQPTNAMYNLMQWGGTGGKGHNAVDMMMQYGTPSEAGRPIANLAQYGITGQAGLPLWMRAMGGPSAGANYLAAYQR